MLLTDNRNEKHILQCYLQFYLLDSKRESAKLGPIVKMGIKLIKTVKQFDI